MSLPIDDVRAELIDAIQNNRIVLPTLPEVALRIRDAAENPDTDVASFAKELGFDAAISARVMRVANSPLMRGGGKGDGRQSRHGAYRHPVRLQPGGGTGDGADVPGHLRCRR